MRKYGKQLLIAIDQLVNAIIGGWADETLSSRAYRSDWRTTERIINLLFWWDKQTSTIGTPTVTKYHCELSYLSEMKRLQLSPEMREEGRCPMDS